MNLLKVTIENADRSFIWLFDGASDKRECVRKTLEELVEKHGFSSNSEVCQRFPAHCTPDDEVFGFLVLASEDLKGEKLEDKVDDGNTYWVLCEDYKLGSLFATSALAWIRLA